MGFLKDFSSLLFQTQHGFCGNCIRQLRFLKSHRDTYEAAYADSWVLTPDVALLCRR